ncbi:MAG: peptide MFS transporter [Myxococcaceae bacterium]
MATNAAPNLDPREVPAGGPSVTGATPNSPPQKGHPPGLYFLFATEMWERFSYYGMRALLVLYLISYLQFQPSKASEVYKWYTSLVYLAPLFGGFLADRFLGLRKSIMIGAVLMAIGHFLMAFEPLAFLYSALGFLIVGNGFFKPNISTMVGKMYKAGDARRDGAFTIFYMGINIGAFLSPLVCGQWLRQTYGFHAGFAAAGVGMVLGLVVFIVGQKWILKAVNDAGNSDAAAKPTQADIVNVAPEPSEQQPGAGGISGIISRVFPWLMIALAVIVPTLSIISAARDASTLLDGLRAAGKPAGFGDVIGVWVNTIMPIAFSGIAAWMGFTLLKIKGASRDKSSVIFIVFIFAVLFWMAFEQAGNSLNIWAEFNTNRKLGGVKLGAETYQSFNAIFIVMLAPVFAMMWTALARRGKEVPTALKMFLAMVFTVLSFGAMVAAGASENGTITRVPLAEMPSQITLEKAEGEQVKGVPGDLYVLKVPNLEEGQPPVTVHAGRMFYDKATHELVVRGALPPFAAMDALRPTVDAAYLKSVNALEKGVKYASKEKPVTMKIGPLPQGYALPKIEDLPVSNFDPATGDITLTGSINAVAKAKLVGAGAGPEWRAAVETMAEKADIARVTGWWLVLNYLLATLGELCLSPVGLSMVTKLAPARYASLFMGVWLLASSVAQYVGGSLGEMWGTVAPTNFFVIFVVTSLIGAAVLLPLIIPLKKLMHEVK